MSYSYEAGLSLGASYTGQASSLTAQVLDNTGSLLLNIPTFVEIGSGTGIYGATITLNDSWNGVIVYTWTGTPALGILSEPISAKTAPSWYTAPVDVSASVATILGRVDVNTSSRASATDYTTARAAKLDNLDVVLSTRLATSGYTAPDNTSITTILGRVDVNTSTRASATDYTTARAAKLDNLDVVLSTRLASSGYTAPDNTSIATILTRVDVNTSTRADGASYTSARAGKLDNLDVVLSTRLASSGYTAPDNATIGTISTAVSTVITNQGTINTNVLSRLATSSYTTPPAVAVDGSGRVVLQPAEHTSIGTETAAAVLVTPANKVATNASGQVVASSVAGSVGSVTAGVTVTTNSDKTGYALTTAEHTAISGTDVPAALTAQGYTSARGTKLDNLDATVSSRNATAPDNAGIAAANASLATVITNEGTINTNVLTRLPTSSYVTPPAVAVDGSGRVALQPAEHTAIGTTDTVAGLTAQGYTSARAGYLDTLNGLVTAIWGATTRTLSAFGFTVAANNLPSDYQQRGVAVTLPSTAPSGYGGGSGTGGSGPTTDEINAALFITPGSKLALDGSGRVVAASVAGNVAGSVGSVTGAVGSVTGAVTVGTNNDKAGYALTGAEHTAIGTADVPAGLNQQGYTGTRAAYLDVLNGLVSAIWSAATRTLSAFGFSVPASNLPTDYQQRGVAVTLPAAPSGYGGNTTAPDNAGIATLVGLVDVSVSSRLAASAYTAPATDYQQRGVAVTLPSSPPSGYGGSGGGGGSGASADELAAALLVDPTHKLATDANGKVTVNLALSTYTEAMWDGTAPHNLAHVATAIMEEGDGSEQLGIDGVWNKTTQGGLPFARLQVSPPPASALSRTRVQLVPPDSGDGGGDSGGGGGSDPGDGGSGGGTDPTPPATTFVAMGAWTPPGNVSPYDGATAAHYAATFNHPAAIIHYYQDRVHSPNLDASKLSEIFSHSAVPLLSLEMDDYTGGATQPAYSNASFINGDHDADLTTYFTALGATGHKVLLRPFWEMTGRWYPWAAGCNGNSPESFIAAWRHVARLARLHAPLAQLVWCPSVAIQGGGLASIEDCYPGNSYVDVLSLDGYNKSNAAGNSNPGGVWMSFSQVFKPSYDQLVALNADKPILLAEYGCQVDSRRPAWMAAIPAALDTMPRITGMVWWNNQVGALDCRLTADQPTLDAYRALAALPQLQGTWT